MNFKYLIIFSVLLVSCSHEAMFKKSKEVYAKLGIVKNKSDLNVQRSLSQGEAVLLGKVLVNFNGVDVTSTCGVHFKGPDDEYGHLLDSSGELRIGLKEGRIYLEKIGCVINGGDGFAFVFRPEVIALKTGVFDVGSIRLDFKIGEHNSPCKLKNWSTRGIELQNSALSFKDPVPELNDYQHKKVKVFKCER